MGIRPRSPIPKVAIPMWVVIIIREHICGVYYGTKYAQMGTRRRKNIGKTPPPIDAIPKGDGI